MAQRSQRSTCCDSNLESESRRQVNNFQPDEKTNGTSQDFFVRDGKVFYSAAVSAIRLGYASDHITRLARQGKILASNERGKWFVNEESLIQYRKQAKQNKVLGGLKSTSGLVNVSRLQQKTPGFGWGSSSGDDKNLVLSDQPVKSGDPIVLSSLPVIDGDAYNAGFIKPEVKDSRYLSSGYAHRTVNRAVIVLTVLLFAVAASIFFVKKMPDQFSAGLVKPKLNYVAKSFSNGLAAILAQIEEPVENNPLLSDYEQAIKRLQDILKQEEQEYEALANKYQQQFLAEGGSGDTLTSGGITNRVLSFQFSGGEASVLKEIARRVSAGELLIARPGDSANLRGLIDDLNSRLAQLNARVDQIPPPLQYSGGGGGTTSITVGSGDAQITGSKLTIGNTEVGSGSISTTSGNLTLSAAGSVIISDNFSVTGSTSFNGVAYGWPSADGSGGQVLSTNGSGILSWATISGKTSDSIDFDEIVASASLDTNWDVALNDKSIDIGDGKFFISSSGNIGFGTRNLTQVFELVGNASISGTASVSGDLVF